MKTKITIIVFMLTISAMARLPSMFPGWERLKAESPEIIVVAPGNPTTWATNIVAFENGPNYDYSVTVLSVLKGTNVVRHARLLADHELRPREACLVYCHYDEGVYIAHGDFRVVPLGKEFKREMIENRPLDEQPC